MPSPRSRCPLAPVLVLAVWAGGAQGAIAAPAKTEVVSGAVSVDKPVSQAIVVSGGDTVGVAGLAGTSAGVTIEVVDGDGTSLGFAHPGKAFSYASPWESGVRVWQAVVGGSGPYSIAVSAERQDDGANGGDAPEDWRIAPLAVVPTVAGLLADADKADAFPFVVRGATALTLAMDSGSARGTELKVFDHEDSEVGSLRPGMAMSYLNPVELGTKVWHVDVTGSGVYAFTRGEVAQTEVVPGGDAPDDRASAQLLSVSRVVGAVGGADARDSFRFRVAPHEPVWAALRMANPQQGVGPQGELSLTLLTDDGQQLDHLTVGPGGEGVAVMPTAEDASELASAASAFAVEVSGSGSYELRVPPVLAVEGTPSGGQPAEAEGVPDVAALSFRSPGKVGVVVPSLRPGSLAAEITWVPRIPGELFVYAPSGKLPIARTRGSGSISTTMVVGGDRPTGEWLLELVTSAEVAGAVAVAHVVSGGLGELRVRSGVSAASAQQPGTTQLALNEVLGASPEAAGGGAAAGAAAAGTMGTAAQASDDGTAMGSATATEGAGTPGTTAAAPSALKVRFNKLMCHSETTWDRGSNSDEVYYLLALVGPDGVVSGAVSPIYGDMDDGDRRPSGNFVSHDVVWEGEVQPGTRCFVALMENDDGSPRRALRQFLDAAESSFANVGLTGTAGPGFGTFLRSTLEALVGGADDLIGDVSTLATDVAPETWCQQGFSWGNADGWPGYTWMFNFQGDGANYSLVLTFGP